MVLRMALPLLDGLHFCRFGPLFCTLSHFFAKHFLESAPPLDPTLTLIPVMNISRHHLKASLEIGTERGGHPSYAAAKAATRRDSGRATQSKMFDFVACPC